MIKRMTKHITKRMTKHMTKHMTMHIATDMGSERAMIIFQIASVYVDCISAHQPKVGATGP